MALGLRLVSEATRLHFPQRLTRLVAKNIALAGVKSLTIFDPEPVTIKDLGTQVSSQSTVNYAVLTHL
jgi:hypothetical protein